eukprot:1123657-Rhodomonas_salina.1
MAAVDLSALPRWTAPTRSATESRTPPAHAQPVCRVGGKGLRIAVCAQSFECESVGGKRPKRTAEARAFGHRRQDKSESGRATKGSEMLGDSERDSGMSQPICS